jgi:two-component system chemotaxis response regulator CheB
LKLESASGVISHYNPSVDHLFYSAVQLVKSHDILAILLTGIGQDGAEGLSALQNAGATCIAESERSAIVFGMPKRAAELNANIKVMHLDSIIDYIKKFGSV